jgi:ParB/RepB/Spo0J family partition protein
MPKATSQLGPGQPAPAPWPDAPEGWRWSRRGAPAHLIAPDGWKTQNYNVPDRALAEAGQHIAVENARWRLVAAGYDVQPQGMHWVVRNNGSDATVLKTAELIDLANGVPTPVPPMQPGSSDGTMPLLDLVSALETHAGALPTPLPRDQRILLPAGLPERLSAPLDLIVPGRYQPRTKFDQTSLDELAASIAEHGILTALKAFANERGQLELIAGERRLRAARQAGLPFVPIEICSYTLRQIDEISTIDNLQRDDLTPIEEGTAYERMIREWQISEAELARRLGKNRAYIQQRRAIADAAPEVIEALDKEQITFSQARAIAQAAPGQAKAQKAALTKLAELAKQGKRTTEAEARAAAEKVVLAQAKKDLTALGWTVSEPYGGFLIWAPSERPKQWTGAEMLEAIAAQRRPTGTAPAALTGAKKGDLLLPTLKIRYRLDDDYPPWIGLSEDYGQPTMFYAAAELAGQAEQITQDLAAMVARAAAAGWTLDVDTSSNYHTAFKFESTQGASHRVWGWSDAKKALDQIEAGKIKAEPQRQTTVQSTTYPCARCQKQVSDYRWIEDAKYCQACVKPVEQEIAARTQRIHSEVASALSAWLSTAPADALRLVVAALPHRRTYNNERRQTAKEIRAADAPKLAGAILAWVAKAAEGDHEYPVHGQAVAADESTAAGDDTPLLDLSERLAKIEAWIDQQADGSPSLDVIQLQRATLEQLADDLDQYAEDDDVSTAAFEDLARRIGQATLALITLAETGSAPELAEVAA